GGHRGGRPGPRRGPPRRRLQLPAGWWASRRPSCRSWFSWFIAVAHAPDGDDPPGRGGVGLDLFPQPPDVHGDRGGVTERPAPYVCQQLIPAERLARPA